MDKQKTLKDIARELGLSHTTVSRALRDHPRIRAETRSLVQATAERMGYVVNSSARSLRGDPSALVGLIVPEIRNPVFSEIARIVSEMFSGTPNQLVLVVSGDDPEREEQGLRALAEARVAGVLPVLSPTPTLNTLRLLHRLKTTLLIRQHRAIAADYVGLDEQQAIGIAVDHLVALGHRRLGFVGLHSTVSTGANRLHGFLDASARAGVETDTRHIVLGPSGDEFGHRAMAALFDGPADPPTGVVISGVTQVMGCVAWLQGRGLRVPQDVSLVAFGDPPWFSFIYGGLTSVCLPVAEIAKAAAQHLLEPSPQAVARAPVQLRFPSKLAVRKSTAPPSKRR